MTVNLQELINLDVNVAERKRTAKRAEENRKTERSLRLEGVTALTRMIYVNATDRPLPRPENEELSAALAAALETFEPIRNEEGRTVAIIGELDEVPLKVSYVDDPLLRHGDGAPVRRIQISVSTFVEVEERTLGATVRVLVDGPTVRYLHEIPEASADLSDRIAEEIRLVRSGRERDSDLNSRHPGKTDA